MSGPTGYKNGAGPALPGDRVRLSNGVEVIVNSAHYYDWQPGMPVGRQQFSVVPPGGKGEYPGPLFYADESELLHRHAYTADPVTKIRRCSCGAMPAMAYLFGPGEPAPYAEPKR